MSCLGCILGWFWSFVKNFFEGHTSPPPRSAFAPPVPLRNEPGYLVYLRNLLCVSLLQQWYTCLSVATSVKISVFGGYFWRGGFVYILRKWIFIFTAFPILFWFVLFCFYSFLLPLFLSYFYLILFRSFVPDSCCLSYCILCYCQPGRGGVAFDSLVNVPRYHVTTLPRYRAATLHVVCGCSLKCRRRATLFCGWRFENLPRCEIVKLFCGRRFATLFALCVSSGGALRLKLLQLLGHPSTTARQLAVNTFKLTC